MEKYQKSRKAFAWITGILMILTGIHYNYNMINNPQAEPILASWILMTTATFLSLWTYLSTFSSKKEKLKGLVSNIGNSTNFIAISSILLGTLFWGKNVRFGFTQFEIWCLVASFVILIIWKFSKLHVYANIAIQIIMVIAYIPIIIHL